MIHSSCKKLPHTTGSIFTEASPLLSHRLDSSTLAKRGRSRDDCQIKDCCEMCIEGRFVSPFPGIFSRPVSLLTPSPASPEVYDDTMEILARKINMAMDRRNPRGGLFPSQMYFGRKRGKPVELVDGLRAPPPTGSTANTASRSHSTPPPPMGETAPGIGALVAGHWLR